MTWCCPQILVQASLCDSSPCLVGCPVLAGQRDVAWLFVVAQWGPVGAPDDSRSGERNLTQAASAADNDVLELLHSSSVIGTSDPLTKLARLGGTP